MDPRICSEYSAKQRWDEALDLRRQVEADPRLVREEGLAGFGSAKGSNEEAYLSRNWCARFRLATTSIIARGYATRRSVAALLEGIGSGAVSNPVIDVTQAEVVILIGANPISIIRSRQPG